MRRPWLAFLGTFGIGLVLIALTLGRDRSTLVYAPSPTARIPVVALAPGDEVCQAPLVLPDDASFDRVRLFTSAPTGPLEVTVSDPMGRTLAAGRVPPVASGGRGAVPATAALREVRSRQALSVCVRAANSPATVWGTDGSASPATSATLNGAPVAYDVALRLERADDPVLLDLGRVAERASLFKAGWVSPLALAVLALCLLVGLPALLLRVLAEPDR